MDWQSKFYSIVRETDENLAKAKIKLMNKGGEFTGSQSALLSPRYALRTAAFSQSLDANRRPVTYQQPQTAHSYASVAPPEELNMSAATGIQVLHMQEQIDAQKSTISQLQKLVHALDSERDFYKQQISLLRGEVDGLSEKMHRQTSLAGNEWQISRIKNEVLGEIEKVKAMLYNQSREVRGKESYLSPRVGEELWNVKESLTENLDHIRKELGLMNKRIDRMESGVPYESSKKLTQDPISRIDRWNNVQKSPRNQTHSYTTTLHSSLDAQQLRSTVNLLNTKLDNLERKLETASSRPKQDAASNHLIYASTPYIPYSSPSKPFLQPDFATDNVDDDVDVDDLSSLSGLSDLSDTEDDGKDDIDEEIEAIIRRSSNKGSMLTPDNHVKSSLYKTESWKKGKVEFDLSDLDLSDVEDVDVDGDSNSSEL